MAHIDPDALVLHALGETVPELDAHLLECPECAAELESLRSAVRVGRGAVNDDRFARPDARVWDAVAAQVGIADATPTSGSAEATSGASTETAAPIAIGGRSRRRDPGRRGRLVPLLAAAAAVLLVAGVGVGVWRLLTPASATVLATASLDALPDWPDTSGSAIVEERPDGTREVQVSLEAPSTPGGYRELWLLNADATALVSLGVVEGVGGTFAIPADVDLDEFGVVDVSAETADGDPGHSGDSIVRGTLDAR